MSRPLPELIDPLRLAGKGSVLKGPLAYNRMTRLQDVLHEADDPNSGNEITIDLAFGIDQSNQANVIGVISADLWIQCQRCLQPMHWQQPIKVSLAFVNSEREAEKLPSRYEPYLLTKSDAEDRLENVNSNIAEDLHSLTELVESEIILALPQEPMHPSDACAIDDRYVLQGDSSNKSNHAVNGTDELQDDNSFSKPNPFAVLKQMKKKDQGSK